MRAQEGVDAIRTAENGRAGEGGDATRTAENGRAGEGTGHVPLVVVGRGSSD